MTERLTEIYPCNKCNVEFCSRQCYSMTRWAEKAKEKLAEYEIAEEEGKIGGAAGAAMQSGRYSLDFLR